jgi:hypothetical protein
LTCQPALVDLVVFAHSLGAGVHLIKHRSAHALYLQLLVCTCWHQLPFIVLLA